MSESTAAAALNSSVVCRARGLIGRIDADGPGGHRAADARIFDMPDRADF